VPPVKEPVQEFFSIGEVCSLTGLKPHVLRYWEGQFRFLSPAKNRSGNRVYQRREVELIQLVQQLLYVEKYTIEGAKRRLDELRKAGEQRPAARDALRAATWRAIEDELREILRVVQGREGSEG
jgi:DNA-binding transcriptional MerR regulator